MPWPDSMYQAPLGSTPACFHSPSSSVCVPDLSPRETKRDWLSAILFIASSALDMPLTFAGSSSGPMMTKSLYMTRRRLSSLPSSTYFRSTEGAWASVTSASPRAAKVSACPVPTEIVLTVSPVFFSNMGTSTSRSPESCVLVVVDRITVADCAQAGPARAKTAISVSRVRMSAGLPVICSREHNPREPRRQRRHTG